MLHADYELFLSRLEQGLSKEADLSKLPEWICTNTRHPRRKEHRFNFNEHEFQIDIARDASASVAIRKVSQVGLSELSVRIALAIGFMRDLTVIYVLPSGPFAANFSKGRIDPVVTASPTLSARKSKKAYSVGLKQIGGMTMYVVGAGSTSSAISIPAQLLVRDEFDFADQTILSNFDSRLGHNKLGQSFTRDFSTPTVANYGIDKLFKAGHQAWYAVKHEKCGQWVIPKFLEHVVIPGFDGTALNFEKHHLEMPEYRVDDAYVLCPHCRNKITIENLATPSLRSWVAAHPDRTDHSYQVQSFDVPTINPPSRTLRQLIKYSMRRDWVNFKVGDVSEDSSNSFNPALLDGYMAGPGLEIRESETTYTNAVMGIDVGITSWITIGKRIDGRLRLLHLEQVIGGVASPDALYLRVTLLMRILGISFAVIDSMPDFNTAARLCAEHPGRMLACEYAESLPTPLETLLIKEDRMVVKAHRNKRFDLLVMAWSGGQIRVCTSPELPVFKKHLEGMKKTRLVSEEDAESIENAGESWQKTGDDHYLHSLNYCYIADELIGKLSVSDSPPCLPVPGKIKYGVQPEDPITPYLPNNFGGRMMRGMF